MNSELESVKVIFGNPAKERAVAARVKVVKKDTPEHDAAQAQIRVEISLLRLLAAKHPRIVRELVDVPVK